MKKDYVKPEIHYESFVLNQSIAACGIDMNLQSPIECNGQLDPNFNYDFNDIVFTSGNVDCVTEMQEYCYTNGPDMSKLFNS